MKVADPVVPSVVGLIEQSGYAVTTSSDRIIATGTEGETHVVTGSDSLAMACELAEQLGVELDDG